MLALSNWQPQMELELGSSCISRARNGRKQSWYLGCHGNKRSNFLVVSGNSKAMLSRKFDLDCGFFYRSSKIKVLVFSDPKIGSFNASFALAWALEEHTRDVIDTQEVEIVRKEEKSVKDKPKRVDVRALGRRLQSAKSCEEMEEVLKDKGELPLQVYSTIIRGFGKEKKFDAAMILVDWLKRRAKTTNSPGPNLFIYNSVLGAVKESGSFDEVEKVMNDMTIEGISPNVVSYNTLMGIYLEQKREGDALDLFDEIQKKGLSPSPASYSIALLAYRRLEDGFGALNFYVELKEKYRNGDIGKDSNEDWEKEFRKLVDFTVRISYQVMRCWLVKDENLSTRVLKLLVEMDKAGLEIGRLEHERLVWACTREEHYIVAKELYSRIRESESSEISLSVCNHVIWLMGKAKKWWAALEIYEDLLDIGPKPNNMSYELVVSHFNILLSAARKRGIWRWGVRLLNKMEDKGLKPGTREWNSVLIACSKASESTAAVQIFKRMVENGEKPTVVSYGALLSALEKGKLYDEALKVWDHMIKVGVEPNLYVYTIMASIYAAQGKLNVVDCIIRDMVAAGIEPTVVTYNAIISACAKNNFGSFAYEWFHRMKGDDILISPNEVSYEMLIEALVGDGKPRLAYEMYLRACNEGLSLSSKAYDAVMECSEVYGGTIDLSALGPRPEDRKKKATITFANVPTYSTDFDKEIYVSQQTDESM